MLHRRWQGRDRAPGAYAALSDDASNVRLNKKIGLRIARDRRAALFEWNERYERPDHLRALEV